MAKKKNPGKVLVYTFAPLTTVMVAATLVATIVFSSIISTVAGGERPILNPDCPEQFHSEFKNKKELLEAGAKLNLDIEGEGATLLLNENKALPLAKGSKVSVFGRNSTNLVLSGSGSGSAGSDGSVSIYDSLDDAGFEYNKDLKNFYESGNAGVARSEQALSDTSEKSPVLRTGETPVANYPSEVKDTFRNYNDAAIVVISRIGGESFDLPRSQDMKNGGIEGNHYLQLDQNEYDMLDMVTSKFDKVIVLLNTLTSFQLDFIEEYNNTQNNKRIDAVMWIGGPGINGASAIGKLLNGEINPSGKTVDTYARDFTKDPTWQNFGDNSQNFDGSLSANYTQNGENVPGRFQVSYEEGIYVGYKYYETRGYEEVKADSESTWYEDNVVYPFGYGLSYTTFNQKLVSVTGDLNTGLTVTAEVENTGSVAGKDAVELYVTLPYTYGGIEKSYAQLIDFNKTKVLAPGEKQTLTFKVNGYDLASYDYNDANKNNFAGWELEAGDYVFTISSDSHIIANAYGSKTVNLATSVKYEEDPVTHNPVVNRYTFDQESEDKFLDLQYRLSDVDVFNGTSYEQRKGMSRTNFEETFPSAPNVEEREFLEGESEAIANMAHNNTAVAGAAMPTTNDTKNLKLKLRDMYGKDYDDAGWDEILNSLTFEEMKALSNNGAFLTEGIEKIGKNLTNDSDGPVGFVNFMPGLSQHYKDNPTFACEIVIASTWNKDLAYQMGKMVGETGLLGDIGGNNLPYTGWYAPAVNLHRSPFSGRNYEYYSEDPIISGKMAVNVINGTASKGVYCDLKHFALNDQETNRANICTFTTEQALRELYLKPFEMGVKGNDDPSQVATATADGITTYVGTKGIMSSFNRIGTKWTGGDYRLLTEILRNEWGFRGLVICDYKTDNSFMNAKQMLYAGNDLILASLDPLKWTNPDSSNAEDVLVLRTAAHNILYTVANSNSINKDIIGYKMPLWKAGLIALDSVLGACAVAGAVLWVLNVKKGKKEGIFVSTDENGELDVEKVSK